MHKNFRPMPVLKWISVVAGVLFIFSLLILWGNRIPKRPANISPRGIFLEIGVVPFKFSTHGDWLDCWKDEKTNSDRCKYTDELGKVYFEDFVLPYEGISPVPDEELVIDPVRTRSFHYGVTDKDLRFPLIILRNGEILLPQSDYEWGKKNVDYWITGKTEKIPRR
jgi:hypothetical protein